MDEVEKCNLNESGFLQAAREVSIATIPFIENNQKALNSIRYSWSGEEMDKKLYDIMDEIHNVCISYGCEKNGYCNYVKDANITGIVKVADTMLAQGSI